MDFSLSPEQKARRREIVAFARAELDNDGAAARYAAGEFPRSLWDKCAAHKLHALSLPEEFGGGGLDGLDTILAMEAFGYGCEDGGFVFAMGAHQFACASPLAKFASDVQKAKYLPGLCDGSLIGVNCMTEPGAGSDLNSIGATAVRDGDGYRLNGVKVFGTNGPVADVALVFAVTDPAADLQGKLTPFLVDAGTEGFRVAETFDLMGHRTASIGRLELEDVYVSAESVVGSKEGGGTAIFQHAMTWERVALFAAHVGAMERLLEQSVKVARTRKQFDQPIGKFQGVSHKIADMKVRLEAAKLLTYRAATKLGKSRDAAFDASIAKLFVSEAFVDTATDAMQIHGGAGYSTALSVERDLRDAHGCTLYSGASEIHRNIIAAWLGL